MEAARLDSHTQETLSAPAVEAALALAERPEALLDKREELGEECQRAVKVLFDLAKRLEPKRFTPLPELLVEGAGQIVGNSLDGAAKLRAIGARIIIFGRMARGALRSDQLSARRVGSRRSAAQPVF